MSKSSPNSVPAFAIALMLLSILCAGPAISRPQISNHKDTVLTRVHDFLQDFYPELFGRNLLLNLGITQGIDSPWQQIYDIQFDVKLYNPLSERMLNPPFDPKTGKQLSPPENTVLLQGDLWFNRDGWLHQFNATGASAQAKQNEAIHKLVESHPEWSEDEALRALKQAGARYCPTENEQFLRVIQLQKLERFTGHLKLNSVEFEGLTEPHEGNFASLSWVVRVDADLPDGTHSRYTLHFEPFDGKLILVLKPGELLGTIREDRRR